MMVAAFIDVVGLGDRPWYGNAGISLGPPVRHAPPFRAEVLSVEAGQAADRAGLRVGDLIDIRHSTPLERWQWFDGFPTPITGTPTTFVVERNGQTMRAAVVPRPWDLSRYWYVFLGPLGMFFLVLIAMLIAWRAEPTKANLMLSGVLLLIGAGAMGETNEFAVPWAWVYDALGVLALMVPAAMGLWATYASSFATPLSRGRLIALRLCYASLLVTASMLLAQVIGLTTLWYDPMTFFSPVTLLPPNLLCTALALLCSLLALRASTGSERQRAAWALISLTIFFVIYDLFITGLPLFSVAGSYTLYLVEIGIGNANMFVLPIVLAYAVLSHRLIDLGFILNRATVFAFVSLVVVGAFLVIEWAFSHWLESATHATNAAFGLGVAVALGFSVRYVHGFVDRFVDRVFFRKRHEDEAALRAFAHECSYITDPMVLLERAVSVVSDHTATAGVEVIRPQQVDENDTAVVALKAWGKPIDLHGYPRSSLRGELAFPMISRGKLVGALVCRAKTNGESFAPDEIDAIATLAHSVGVTLDALAPATADGIAGLHRAIDEMRDAIVAELRTFRVAQP